MNPFLMATMTRNVCVNSFSTMEPTIKVNGTPTAKRMDREPNFGKTLACMKAIGNKAKLMVEAV